MINKNFFMRTIITALIFCALTILSPQNASAQDLSYNLSSTLMPVVADKAGILTDYEEVTILNRFTELRDASGFQFIFMTATDTMEYAKGNEIESMYAMQNDALYGTGTIFFLISTDSDYLICEIQAYSLAKDIFTHEVCAYMNEKLRGYIEDGNYYEGVMKFFDYYNQAYDGTLDITDGAAQEDSGTLTAYIKNHMTLTILIAAISVLITALLYAFTFTLTAKKSAKVNKQSQKISKDSAIFVGNVSYKYKLTADRITYIRSRVSK